MAVTFKDLCLDARDPAAAAAFWGPVLGLPRDRERDGLHQLGDEVEAHTVWVNPVPEAKTVKHRVHLDVHVASVDELLARGARVVDDTQPWTVLTDPDGGEFCAFVRTPDTLTAYRMYEVVVDCVDPERVARWWGEQLGVPAQAEQDFWWLDGGSLPFELIFGAVPEPKTGKNRVHWDVTGSTEELLAAGASLLRARDDERAWDVLADPEGNEFCVFAPE